MDHPKRYDHRLDALFQPSPLRGSQGSSIMPTYRVPLVIPTPKAGTSRMRSASRPKRSPPRPKED